MKIRILTAVILVMTGLTANAQMTAVTILEKTVVIPVDISTAKVKLSQADYAMPMVKVLVPKLADATVLDHRNTGEGAPCMSTIDTMNPKDVIQDKPESIEVPMNIKLSKVLYKNLKDKTCHVSLSEEIETNIRGFHFVHFKSEVIGTRHIDDCR